MSDAPLKIRIMDAMKDAMKSGDHPRRDTIRLITAALKQREVDERISLTDEHILSILDKMVKQRRDSIDQYQAAARQDLADKEVFEINIIQEFLPAALTEAEIMALIDAAIQQTGAASAQDMGKVMAILKPQIQGRADAGNVSSLVKQRLSQ